MTEINGNNVSVSNGRIVYDDNTGRHSIKVDDYSQWSLQVRVENANEFGWGKPIYGVVGFVSGDLVAFTFSDYRKAENVFDKLG